jgi:hypothetical protein
LRDSIRRDAEAAAATAAALVASRPPAAVAAALGPPRATGRETLAEKEDREALEKTLQKKQDKAWVKDIEEEVAPKPTGREAQLEKKQTTNSGRRAAEDSRVRGCSDSLPWFTLLSGWFR